MVGSISVMATDERNFRSAYYEKVGFRSVEEKKSLEILLKDKSLDHAKLKQFCLRFTIPATYRNLVWKLLLGVIPIHEECHAFIKEQRQQEYNDLQNALRVLRLVDSSAPKSQVLLTMWFLQKGHIYFDASKEYSYIAIVKALLQFFDDDIDVYWIAKAFHENIEKFRADFPKLIEITYGLLEKEDAILYEHFQKIDVLNSLPIEKWFDCCFAGILNEAALGKIWDKLCAGSCKILVYVVIILFTNQRSCLLNCKNLSGILICIKNLSEEAAEVIANKSIEIWQQHGSPLTVNDKPKP